MCTLALTPGCHYCSVPLVCCLNIYGSLVYCFGMSSLSLPPAEAERCAGQFLAKCYELGLVMNEAVGSGTTHVSTTLQPLTISRAEFDELCHVQSLWNEAVDNTARNFSFLRDALRETAASDDGFTGKLVDILVKVYLGTKPYQKLMLGIFRTDYMRHEDDNGVGLSEASRWRNVEINTISCSFAGLSPLVTKFHEHVGVHLHVWRKANGIVGEKDGSTVSKASGCDGGLVLERSTSGRVVPGAIADAVHAWTKQQKFNLLRESYSQLQACTGCGNDSPQGKLDASPIVLVVVQENERNMADQYALLLKVLEEHHIHFIFRTLQELHMSMKLHYINPNQPPLAVVDGKYPVAVAYFRSTYVPGDLPTDAAWATRLDLERSSAIKCPSIPHHLLTFKKMQQLFCDMDRVLVPIAFRGDSDKARRLKRHFVPQYSLNPCEVG
uniref:Glutathione synthetase n=1 Tax=Trypanosoma congolense (strain IL3000) TaxID=1068625 RepID=G0UQ44_TRYCI|nr:putative glutathione synthetase [Trypanosoma congolense IL3000]